MHVEWEEERSGVTCQLRSKETNEALERICDGKRRRILANRSNHNPVGSDIRSSTLLKRTRQIH